MHTCTWSLNACQGLAAGKVLHTSLCYSIPVLLGGKWNRGTLGVKGDPESWHWHLQAGNKATLFNQIFLPSPDKCCCLLLLLQLEHHTVDFSTWTKQQRERTIQSSRHRWNLQPSTKLPLSRSQIDSRDFPTSGLRLRHGNWSFNCVGLWWGRSLFMREHSTVIRTHMCSFRLVRRMILSIPESVRKHD